MNILLVEDAKLNVNVIKYQLSKLGHLYVKVASNGTAALDMTMDERFSVILMDIELPGMSGVEVTRYIRDETLNSPNLKTPIIAMTAYVSDEIEQQCLDVGMAAFLMKPVHKDRLGQVLKEVLEGEPVSDFGIVEEKESKAMLDRDAAIEMMGGDVLVYASLWSMFEDEVPSRLEKLELALRAQDQETSQRYIHQLKGLCKTMGAFSCSATSADLLQFVKENKMNEALEVFHILERDLKKVIESE
ncbi:MAG: response regulator [Pseudodesulfovibrio sp.]